MATLGSPLVVHSKRCAGAHLVSILVSAALQGSHTARMVKVLEVEDSLSVDPWPKLEAHPDVSEMVREIRGPVRTGRATSKEP